MSRDESDTAKPRATPVRTTSQMPRSASSRSVRAGASKPAGYDNPLFTSGDVLGDRETEATDVMPLVVGDHAVLTPRRPESPLVAKLKAQATEKGHKLRQDRILNSSVGVSPSFASNNPFFPGTSPLRSPTTPTDSPAFHKRAAARKPPRLAQPSDADSPRQVRDDDTDSLDSLVLDDGPNPVKVVTPGGTSGCLRAFAPGSDAAPDSPDGHSPAADGADTQQAPDVQEKRPSSGSSEGQDGVPGQVAPHDTMPPIGASNPGGVAPGDDAARPCTSQRDRDLLNLVSSNPRSFIGTPGPILDPLKCYIVREKAPRGLLSKAPHVYKLYLEEGKVFLLAARRREHTKCPSYIITQDESSASRRSNTYCGKIRSNFIGTEFQVFDDGERAAKTTSATSKLRQASFFGGKRHFVPGSNNGGSSTTLDGPEKSPLYSSLQRAGATAESAGDGSSSMLDDPSESELSKGDADAGSRGELGVVQYHMNVMGTKGPRKMVIGVPYVDLDTNNAVKWNNGETMLNQLKRGSDTDMIRLVNKVPKWNTTLGAYCLNFNGRVTLASVKNFQLVAEHDEQEREVLQFGRVADHRFTMDYAWPLTAYQAFCICITSLDSKLACE